MYPGNAEWLVTERKKGRVPEGLILISFVGRLWVDNFVLFASPKRKYDWRAIKGLAVCAVIDERVDASDLRPIAEHGDASVWHTGKQAGAWIWPDADITDDGRVWIKPGVRSVTWTDWQNDRFNAALNSEEPCVW